MRKLLAGMMAAWLALAAMPVLAAEGASGTAGGKERTTREAQREQWCKANPEKCREMQARREACKADPAKCRAERQARREQWCKENPERCSQMKARMEERGKKK